MHGTSVLEGQQASERSRIVFPCQKHAHISIPAAEYETLA